MAYLRKFLGPLLAVLGLALGSPPAALAQSTPAAVQTNINAVNWACTNNCVTGTAVQSLFTQIDGLFANYMTTTTVVQPSQLPAPTTSSLGGVEAIASTAHQWVSYIDASGVPHSTQPAFSDISGTVPATQLANGAAACNPPSASSPVVSVTCQGAIPDEQDATAETVTLSGYNLTATPGIFAPSDVGKTIYVQGGGTTPTQGYIASATGTIGAGYQAAPTVSISGSPTTQAYPAVVMVVATVTQTGAGTSCPNGPFTGVQLGVAHTPQTVPTVSGVVAGNVMTSVALLVAGEWVNDYPTASGLPALTGIPVIIPGCATYPTVTMSLGAKVAFGAAYHGSARGAGYPTSGVTATFSGGSPTTAATLGTVVVGTWTPPLKATITGYTSPTQVTLSASAGTPLTAQTENIRWCTLNTTAFQAAANIAQSIYVPPGRYCLDEVTLKSNTSVYCDGPGGGQLFLAGDSYNPMFYGASTANVSITRCNGTGNTALFITNQSGSAFASFGNGSSNIHVDHDNLYSWGRHCIAFDGGTDLWADDDYISGCEFGRGISFSISYPSYHVHAVDDHIYLAQWASIGATDITDGHIQNNISGGSNLGWGDSAYGLTEDCYTFYSADPTNAWIIFTGNSGTQCGNNAAHIGCDHCKIEDNAFQNYALYCLVIARAPNSDPAEEYDVSTDRNHCLGSSYLSQGRGDGITIRNTDGGTAEGNECDTVYSCLYFVADGALTGNRAFVISGNMATSVYHFLEAENKLVYSYIGQNTGDQVDSDFILFGNQQVIGSTSFPPYYNRVGTNKMNGVVGYAVNENNGGFNIVDQQDVTNSTVGTISLSAATSYANLAASPSLVATGTTQAGALPLNYQFSIVGTCASGAGVLLVADGQSTRTTVSNQGANACLVYPPVGARINGLSTNAGYSLAAGTTLDFIQFSATQWYTH